MQPLEQIRAIAERVARSHGLEVWDIVSRRETTGQIVRVFIDRPGPAATAEESVSIEDCEQVSREIGTILDVEDPLPFGYTLEVSSPGLDRPLRKQADFVRFTGQKADVRMRTPDGSGRRRFVGLLRGAVDGRVTMELEGQATVSLGLDDVERARLVPEL